MSRTWSCKCGNVVLKLTNEPVMCFNCHCHGCVASMEHIEKKGGTSAAVSDVNRGVAVALWQIEDVEFQGAGSLLEMLSFCKVGEGGSNVRSYTKCCGTLVNASGGATFPTNFRPFNRNCIANSDGSPFELVDVVNVNAKSAFDPAKVPEPKHATVPVGSLFSFIKGAIGRKMCGTFNETDKAFWMPGNEVDDVVPNTWDLPDKL